MIRHGAPHRRVTPAGMAFAVSGASLWGLSFVVPLFMPGVSPWDVSLGRYLFFGCIGFSLMLRSRARGQRLTLKQWGSAFVLAGVGYYFCYTTLVYAIEKAGPALPTLVMGLAPLTVAITANLRTREVPMDRLALPLGLSCAGLAMVNFSRHAGGLGLAGMEEGLLYSGLSLASLTLNLVGNIVFLRSNPEVTPLAWTNATGSALMAFSAAALIIRLAFFGGDLPWTGSATTPAAYLAGCLVLGFGVSWLGGVFWNKANALLPAAAAGQCIVFWPISGIVYACLINRALPGPWEAAGMAMVFAGVVWGLKAARPAPRSASR
jgi:drug/metabolite transporter (DMT)-like permease